MNKHTNNLTKLYSRWLEVNNLPQHLSAEDLLYIEYDLDNPIHSKINLNDEQKDFLRSFINIWSMIDNSDYENKMVWDSMTVCPNTKATTYKYS